MQNNRAKKNWNPDAYARHTSFVWKLATPLLEMLEPRPGERILDAGCGDGSLAAMLKERGVEVIGIDQSPEMVAKSRRKGVEAVVGSVTDLPWRDTFDAVLSNALLHWVPEAEAAARSIAASLRPGGRFVAEFGGAGNVANLLRAMEETFAAHREFGPFVNPWYFPTPEAYRRILEAAGFRVESIELIPRPTPMEDPGAWLEIFADGITAALSADQRECFRQEVLRRLRPTNYREGSGWIIDYVRLRLKAVKIS